MAYTSSAAVIRLVSSSGATNALDDLSAGDQTSMWTSILNETDSIINLYIAGLYDASSLSSNYFLNEQAKYIAAHLLTLRLGRAAYYTNEYERAIEYLEKIKTGELKLPDNDGSLVAQTSANLPAMANIIVDDRSLGTPIRTDTFNSAGQQSPDQWSFFNQWWF